MALQRCQELPPKECYDVIARAGSCVIIDVRTGEEFSRGHLKGAENIDYFLPDFKERLQTRDRNARYIVYCRRGHRGRMVMEFLRECGFSDVTNISGGLEQWLAEGLPVEQ
jgi:phage shock protein E